MSKAQGQKQPAPTPEEVGNTESDYETSESESSEESPMKPPPPVPKKQSRYNLLRSKTVGHKSYSHRTKQIKAQERNPRLSQSDGNLPVSSKPPPVPTKSKTPTNRRKNKKLPAPPKDDRIEKFTEELFATLKSFPAVPWQYEVRVNHLAHNAEDVMKNFCTTKNSMRMATRGYLEPMREYAYAANKGQLFALLDLTLSSLHKANKDVHYPKIRLNKCMLDFGFKQSSDPTAPSGLAKKTDHKDSIIVKNITGHTAQVSIQHFPNKANDDSYVMAVDPGTHALMATTNTYTLTIEPANFTLKANARQKISVVLRFRAFSVKLKEVLSIEISGAGSCAEAMQQRSTIPMRLLAMVKANSELAVFGVPMSEAVCVNVGGRRVPGVLVQLHELLKRANGWNIVGIFRKAPAEDNLQTAKQRLNRGQDINEFSPHVHATLIKIWFRDMPARLFQGVRTSVLQQAKGSKEKSLKLASDLPKAKRELLGWLCDVMAEVALKDELNKMNPTNCAIVMGPNLMAMGQKDPMDSVMVMNYTNKVLENLIAARKDGQVVGVAATPTTTTATTTATTPTTAAATAATTASATPPPSLLD